MMAISTIHVNIYPFVLCIRNKRLYSILYKLLCLIGSDIGKDYDKSILAAQQQLDWWRGEQLKQRELFLSRQVETLAATHIRGKCTVTLYNETESLDSYLEKEVRAKIYNWVCFKCSPCT